MYANNLHTANTSSM